MAGNSSIGRLGNEKEDILERRCFDGFGKVGKAPCWYDEALLTIAAGNNPTR